MGTEPRGKRESGFARRVLAIVRRIPPGRVSTYGDVAALAGRPLAWRAVGNIMHGCLEAGVPCHRVVAAGGRLGGYGGDPGLKRSLLAAEGGPGHRRPAAALRRRPLAGVRNNSDGDRARSSPVRTTRVVLAPWDHALRLHRQSDPRRWRSTGISRKRVSTVSTP